MSPFAKDFSKGSLDAIHMALEALGLEPAQIEASLGWNPGRYQQLRDAPEQATLVDIGALIQLAEEQPASNLTRPDALQPHSPQPLLPQKLGKAFFDRRLIHPSQPRAAKAMAAALVMDDLSRQATLLWATAVVWVIVHVAHANPAEAIAIAKILRDGLEAVSSLDDDSSIH